jgi:hypothetical protein
VPERPLEVSLSRLAIAKHHRDRLLQPLRHFLLGVPISTRMKMTTDCYHLTAAKPMICDGTRRTVVRRSRSRTSLTEHRSTQSLDKGNLPHPR